MDISSTSTLIFSHKLDNSFINVILVARNALEAYFISSADLLELSKYFEPFEINGEYKFLSFCLALFDIAPTTILSGYIKSLIASPSLKNSGLDTTSNNFFEELEKSVKFNLIYIDGSHFAEDVYRDAVNADTFLEIDGFIIFDDFFWSWYPNLQDNPFFGIC